MSQFDETKHNRAQDGKFANKPHSEAEGVALQAEGTPQWLRDVNLPALLGGASPLQTSESLRRAPRGED